MADLDDPNTMPKLVKYFSSSLRNMAEINDIVYKSHPKKNSVFNNSFLPPISIQNYLDKIIRFTNCNPSCCIVAYVYIDRFSKKQPSLPINSRNIHRLLITSVLVANKFLGDMYYNNAYYAKMIGISTIEMNRMEINFLYGLDFQFNVTSDAFHIYISFIQREMMSQPTVNLHETVLSLGKSVKNLRFDDDHNETSNQTKQLSV